MTYYLTEDTVRLQFNKKLFNTAKVSAVLYENGTAMIKQYPIVQTWNTENLY